MKKLVAKALDASCRVLSYRKLHSSPSSASVANLLLILLTFHQMRKGRHAPMIVADTIMFVPDILEATSYETTFKNRIHKAQNS